MIRAVVLVCGAVAYAAFLGSFTYLMAFMADIGVTKGVDSGEAGPLGLSLLINSLLVTAFGLQHAVMARDAFKSRWTRIVPESLERSVFVAAASLVLALLFWQWRPIPAVVWDVESPWLRGVIWSVFASGT